MRKVTIWFILFVWTSTVFAQKRILMENLGVSQDKDITPIVLEALQQADFKDAILVFPKGTYHFYPERAIGKYHAVTNHDNSYKYFAFPLIGCTNIEIDGGGSDFIFHGVMTPFLVENSMGIKLKNFSIDWKEPFYLQAEVLESNALEQYVDIAVNPMTKTEFEGNRLGFVTNGLSLPFLGESMVFDPKTNAVAYNAQSYLLNGVASRKTFDQSLGGNNYRIKARFAKTPAPAGLIYIFKGPNRSNRLAPAIHLTNSSNLHLDKLNIYHAGGMGVIAEKSENIHLNEVNVKLREGSGRMVSTTADATHFCNCKGELVIENCLFENMLDDASNIHGTYVKISELVDKHTIRAGVNHIQQFDYNFASSGDKVEFITNETLLPIAPATVKSFKKINDHLFELSFVEELPATLKVNDAVDNVTWYPTTIFRNNVVRNNRARSILISIRNKTVIENNTFSSMMTSILFEGDLNHWYESGAVDDVLIRNNIFYDCVYGGGKGSVIWINPRMKQTLKYQPYEKNIVIEDNEFRTFDNSILSALSVDGLIFRNNKIIESGTYPKLWPGLPVIEVRDGLNTLIQNNSFEGKEKARIVIDENSSRSLKIDKKQKGFVIDKK